MCCDWWFLWFFASIVQKWISNKIHIRKGLQVKKVLNHIDVSAGRKENLCRTCQVFKIDFLVGFEKLDKRFVFELNLCLFGILGLFFCLRRACVMRNEDKKCGGNNFWHSIEKFCYFSKRNAWIYLYWLIAFMLDYIITSWAVFLLYSHVSLFIQNFFNDRISHLNRKETGEGGLERVRERKREIWDQFLLILLLFNFTFFAIVNIPLKECNFVKRSRILSFNHAFYPMLHGNKLSI